MLLYSPWHPTSLTKGTAVPVMQGVGGIRGGAMQGDGGIRGGAMQGDGGIRGGRYAGGCKYG